MSLGDGRKVKVLQLWSWSVHLCFSDPRRASVLLNGVAKLSSHCPDSLVFCFSLQSRLFQLLVRKRLLKIYVAVLMLPHVFRRIKAQVLAHVLTFLKWLYAVAQVLCSLVPWFVSSYSDLIENECMT